MRIDLLGLKTGIMNNAREICNITWLIENYSFCWHKNGEVLTSPKFTASSLQGTVYSINLYPRGRKFEHKDYISLYIHRIKGGNGPKEFLLGCSLSILAADGATLCSEQFKYEFKEGLGVGANKFERIAEILLDRKAQYLPQDTLTVECKICRDEIKQVECKICRDEIKQVKCKICRDERNIQEIKQITARTRIGIKRVSFLHVIENFTTFESNQRNTVDIGSPSKAGLSLTCSMYFTDGLCCDEKIMVEITPTDNNHSLSKCKLSLIDKSGKLIQCGEVDNYISISTRNDVQKLPLSLTRQTILKRNDDFLPEDEFKLLCECTFSTGIEYENVEMTLYEIPIDVLKQIQNTSRNKVIYNAPAKLSACARASDDFKALYNNQILTDVVLETQNKSFPAHKSVLCARSSVFKAMLTLDMKEKNRDCIQVDDLEDDIVQQFLLFLYSDHLENLDWESSIKLYYAGDKYAVEKLKVMCASFLVDNLSTSNAIEVLLLADFHNDFDLKVTVEDFIFKFDEEIFGSKKWGEFIKTNSVLASETMRLKYVRKL